MKEQLSFLDLFAGAGGLSEGFIRAGFEPVAHVESDESACNTLRTRTVRHWLVKEERTDDYYDYLHGRIRRSDLYSFIPEQLLSSIIHDTIHETSLGNIFNRIDEQLNGTQLDLIIGGPPCQAYSLVGRSRDSNRMRNDQRNHLYVYFAEFLKRYRPGYFLFENVSGLLTARSEAGKLYFDSMRQLFKDIGYETEYKLLSADEYGVPQSRKRIILVGKRGSKAGFYPEPSEWNPEITVNDVLNGLPALQAGDGQVSPCGTRKYANGYLTAAGITSYNVPVTFHIARPHGDRDLEIYQIAVKKWHKEKQRLNYNDLPDRLKTHKNRGSFTDRFKVVAGEKPYSHTVVAHIAKDGHYYIHPDIRQNRSLTPREAARLQTFPDDYFFESVKETPGRTAAFRQIGNAV